MGERVYANGDIDNVPIELTEPYELRIDSGSAEQAGAITDEGTSFGIEKTGAGTLVLTGENTYDGPTLISAGELVLASGATISTASDFTIAEGAALSFGDDVSVAFLGSIAGGGDIDLGAGVYLELDDLSADLIFSGSIFDDDDGIASVDICGCGGGSLTITGTVDIGGLLDIGWGGTLILDGGSFAADGGLLLDGTFRIVNGGTFTTTAILGTALIIDGAGSSATASDLTDLTGSLTVSNGGALTSQGDADLITCGCEEEFATADITGANARWDITGTLTLGDADFGSVLTVAGGGTTRATTSIVVGVHSIINIGTGGLAGTIDTTSIGNDGAIVANFTDASTIAAGINGDGTLEKHGVGTLSLDGVNYYHGATTVFGGRLDVNGVLVFSTATVKAGATIGGGGATDDIIVESGGRLAPGTSIGHLTTGSISLAAGAVFESEIAGTTPALEYDVVMVFGTVSLAGAELDLRILDGFEPRFGQSYTIIDNDGSDAVVGAFAGLAEGAVFMVDGRLLTITYTGGDGNDVVIAKTPPPTTITGTDAADLIDATHTVAGQPLPTGDADLIYGLGGGDTIAALGGDDQVEGGDGKDTIAGDDGNDWIWGGNGADLIYGGSGDDTIDGGNGKDTITGGDGDDTIHGGKGKDDIRGDAGNDVLKGNGKNDVLRGGDGDDVLTGGPGKNKLYGGDGNDTFVFRKANASDKIKDFAEGDIIALAKSGFSGLGPTGTLKAKFFHVGDHAETRAQHVLYDEDSGWLLYAKKGSATANPHQLVKIGKNLEHFDHHDILVI